MSRTTYSLAVQRWTDEARTSAVGRSLDLPPADGARALNSTAPHPGAQLDTLGTYEGSGCEEHPEHRGGDVTP